MWSIFTVDEEGKAHVEEVYATELDALTPAAVSEYAASMQSNGPPTIVTLGPSPLQLPP